MNGKLRAIGEIFVDEEIKISSDVKITFIEEFKCFSIVAYHINFSTVNILFVWCYDE